jgi:hypothetical protein
VSDRLVRRACALPSLPKRSDWFSWAVTDRQGYPLVLRLLLLVLVLLRLLVLLRVVLVLLMLVVLLLRLLVLLRLG